MIEFSKNGNLVTGKIAVGHEGECQDRRRSFTPVKIRLVLNSPRLGTQHLGTFPVSQNTKLAGLLYRSIDTLDISVAVIDITFERIFRHSQQISFPFWPYLLLPFTGCNTLRVLKSASSQGHHYRFFVPSSLCWSSLRPDSS